MGKKREKAPADTRKPKHSNDANRGTKGAKAGMRDASTVSGPVHGGFEGSGRGAKQPLTLHLSAQVRRLAMYDKRAVRDKKGRILSREFQSKELPNTRIQPDRRWFGNTRVIGQKQLEAFREEMGAKVADPYAVLIKEKKLPLSLLEDPEKKAAGVRVEGGGGSRRRQQGASAWGAAAVLTPVPLPPVPDLSRHRLALAASLQAGCSGPTWCRPSPSRRPLGTSGPASAPSSRWTATRTSWPRQPQGGMSSARRWRRQGRWRRTVVAPRLATRCMRRGSPSASGGSCTR